MPETCRSVSIQYSHYLFLLISTGWYIQERFSYSQVDITSTLLWEIKQARDVSHENTVRFVGACIDLPRPTVLILTEYCPRGLFRSCFVHKA